MVNISCVIIYQRDLMWKLAPQEGAMQRLSGVAVLGHITFLFPSHGPPLHCVYNDHGELSWHINILCPSGALIIFCTLIVETDCLVNVWIQAASVKVSNKVKQIPQLFLSTVLV